MTSANRQFSVSVSMLEIYNEIVHDLFTHPSQLGSFMMVDYLKGQKKRSG